MDTNKTKIKLISDSSCDYTKEDMLEKGVEVVPFYVSFDSKEYFKEHSTVTTDEFYQTLIDNPDYNPKTSCPSIFDYEEVFRKYVKEGYSLIVICITSKFSGSFNSANVARENILEEIPDAKIAVIDSKVNTVLQGILVDEVVDMINHGMEYDDVVKKIEEIKETGKIFFTIQNLIYLKKGGRIGRVAAIIANMANLRPLICLEEGDIHAFGIAFGRKKSVQKVIEKVQNYFKDNNLNYGDYAFAIGYGKDYEEGLELVKKLKEVMGEASKKAKIKISQIGATIAVHTGPFPLGIGIIKKAYD